MLDDKSWIAGGIINLPRGVSCGSSVDFHAMQTNSVNQLFWTSFCASGYYHAKTVK